MTLAVRPAGFRGVFREDLPARAVYAEAAGIARELPLAVARPADRDDLLALVAWAHAVGVTLVPRGSGSSMAGGAIGPGVVVDLSRWQAIGPVDVERRRVRVGPGAVCAAVDAAARAVGLRFPVDPSSGRFCTIGGMVGTNAAGARTLGFGATRAWVHGVECVFADGTTGWLRRGEGAPRLAVPEALASVVAAWRGRADRLVHAGVRKESSGYGLAAAAASGSLVDVVVGSEGTVALVTAVELSLCPVAAATVTVLGGFAGVEAAADAAILAHGAGAVACELLEETFLAVAAGGGVAVPAGARAVLLAEVEGGSEEQAGAAAEALARTFRSAGATVVEVARTAEQVQAAWALRHAASPILSRLDPALRSMQFIEDGCVPPARFAAYVRGVRRALDAAGVRGVLFGHAGDAHLHVNPLVDLRQPDWAVRVRGLLDEVTGLVASLGGTVAGEHGDGRLRAPLLGRVWSAEALEAFAEVRQAADPHGVLNRGAKVARSDAPSWMAIKYDPSCPAADAAAAQVLARVEAERRWELDRLAALDEATGGGLPD